MRLFKCRPFDEFEVDLDDPKTYEDMPNTTRELWKLIMEEFGYAYWYMNYRHKDIYDSFGGRKK